MYVGFYVQLSLFRICRLLLKWDGHVEAVYLTENGRIRMKWACRSGLLDRKGKNGMGWSRRKGLRSEAGKFGMVGHVEAVYMNDLFTQI